jgi:hypothetical protein
MMNNPLVIESARAFAERVQKEGGDALEGRVRFAYELAYGRPPRPEESKVLYAAMEANSKDPSQWLVLCQALLGANDFLYSY